jgi:hypothetical protein
MSLFVNAVMDPLLMLVYVYCKAYPVRLITQQSRGIAFGTCEIVPMHNSHRQARAANANQPAEQPNVGIVRKVWAKSGKCRPNSLCRFGADPDLQR